MQQDLQDLARTQMGSFAVCVEPMQLNDVVSDVVASTRVEAQEYGISVEAHLDDSCPPIQGDAGRLRQVLLNLVRNALKFTPEGGKVQVHTSGSGDDILCSVRDTGRGLAADEIGRLFEPFVQVHEKEEARERGSGLGLFIAKTIMESHEGRIYVESEGLGEGSAFTIQLPVRGAIPVESDASANIGEAKGRLSDAPQDHQMATTPATTRPSREPDRP